MATEFSTQSGDGKYRIQFETDNKDYWLLMQETARRCIDHEPRTNADMVRGMSDKKLAWWLAERYAKEVVLSLQEKGVTLSATEIKAVTEQLYLTWARWLRQPAEVEDGN